MAQSVPVQWASVPEWQRLAANAINELVRKAESFAPSVKDYGARGDGVSRDGAAFDQAFKDAAINGGVLVVPPGRYILDSIPTAPTGSFALVGLGGSAAVTVVIQHTGAKALSFTPASAFNMVQIVGITLEANNSAGPVPLGIEVSFPSTASFAACQLRISDVRFTSDTSSTSAPYARTWGRAFKLSNVWNAQIFDVSGGSAPIPGDTGNTGFIEAAGGSYGFMAPSINRVRWYYGADMLRGSAYVEGVEFSQSEAVGVTRGVYVPSTTPFGGAGGLYRSQSIWMRGLHIAAHTAGADLDNCFDYVADSCNIQRWADASATNWNGHKLNQVQQPNIVGGKIAGNEASGGISTTGILATGGNSAHGIVSGVVFENCDVQFNLDSSTSGWAIKGNRSTGATADTYTLGGSKHDLVWLNSDGTITYRNDQLSGPIMTGAYTPTLTGVANVTSLSAYQCRYQRTGNMVTISGRFDLRPTAASTYTRFGLSLPVASTFTALEQCCGTAGSGTQGNAAQIVADTVNGRAEVQVLPNTNATHGYAFSLLYQVI